MYFVLIYENRTRKLAEIVVKRVGGMRKNDEGSGSNRHYQKRKLYTISELKFRED
jgi:hypothetical protein